MAFLGLFGHKLSCIYLKTIKLVSILSASDVTVVKIAKALKGENCVLLTLLLGYYDVLATRRLMNIDKLSFDKAS